MFTKNFQLLIFVLFSSLQVMAHPVIYKGGTNIETEQNPEHQHLMLAYTFHPKTAVGFDYIKFNEEKTEFYFAKLNYRLWRQNETDSQANAYLSLGAGQRRENQKYSDSEMAQLVLDWENRDYYLSAFKEYISQKEADPIWHTRARAGLAPFRADYNDVNIWFIAQFEKVNGNNWETTPLMRTFYKNILWELGASLNGNYQFNLMFHL
ncbi:hypothetical protein CIK05_07220 [Bdellovibrio sp. qaytius]|nr:hypothetical protein CIK05_07220 [Bdellovibrio sp. qaytius]